MAGAHDREGWEALLRCVEPPAFLLIKKSYAGNNKGAMRMLIPHHEPLLKTSEAAAILKVSDTRVRQLLEANMLLGFKPGPQLWLIPYSEVQRYLKERKPVGRPPKKGK